jgi:hypothetical protein
MVVQSGRSTKRSFQDLSCPYDAKMLYTRHFWSPVGIMKQESRHNLLKVSAPCRSKHTRLNL